ncbi:Purine nucleoside phosphorylase [Emydomyces testavorans]|uniref:purine-nucleoside phosphorylase n=1 Tax=Emydomyces testavorans TaxID=2070801 RepID=A0AAF0ILL5_9EURO|nr:Purine nucleoside phosphorylase [Emydomyces testavorans]
MAEPSVFKQAQAALKYLRLQLPGPLQNPRVAVICGSGLGGLADTIDGRARVEFDYRDIPYFPASNATWADKLFQHIFLAGLSGLHPLRGPNEEEFGVRFPALSDAYDIELRRTAHRAWNKVIPVESRRRIHEGVYAFCAGPSFETRAECRFLRQLGADLVGMSTVPEIIVARHCGLRVLALSLVTNNAVLSPVPRGDEHLLQETDKTQLDKIVEEGRANHEEVLEAGRRAAADVQKLVRQAVTDMFPKTSN